MISIQYLYESIDDFDVSVKKVDKSKECMVQIFTTILEPSNAVSLAQEIKNILPKAHIIGTSANALIYRGKQFEQHTMITIEQYENSQIGAYMFDIAGKNAQTVADELKNALGEQTPKLFRLFLGAYYPESHQLIDQINDKMPAMAVAGGMSGEIYQSSTLPFVFNDEKFIHEGLAGASVAGNVHTYNRINTAHEGISSVFTITKADGRTIYEIEGENAQSWLQRNLGFKSSQQYDTWEDIANNDPLVRFRIAFADYEKATRFLRFDEASGQITQYFTESASDTKFRISYTSPAKCVSECKETCMEVLETPIEQMFCYSCLFRKLYMTNCADWELSPYHENPISGVFLLGEFGNHNGRNEVLNGSCVLSGICEDEAYENKQYLKVDLDCLEQLDGIKVENEGLFDFLINKKTQSNSSEEEQLLTDALSYERNHQPEFYRYIDANLNMSNMLKYELDKEKFGFDKLCLIKIENADILISYMGQAAYIEQIKVMVERLEAARKKRDDDVSVYVGNSDSFIVAATDKWSKEEFLTLAGYLESYCEEIQDNFIGTPIIMRFVVVFGNEYLLERAYGQAELSKNSQNRMIIHDTQDRVVQDKVATQKELETINTIQYAIANDKVIPYYQGLYNNKLGRIDKYEALMRIDDCKGNILTPYQFLDTAKKYRLYLDLNLKMFQAVLNDFATIDCAVNMNLCAHDIESPRFRNFLRERLKTFHKPENLTFEILEDEYFSDMEVLKEFIAEVRGYGVKIAIDDFGSGYSNLLEIVKIQPDILKIDGAIIREAHLKYENEILIGVISTLGKELDIHLVAEFVENQDIQNVIEKYEILRSQGYLFAKPEPFGEVLKVQKQVANTSYAGGV